MGFVSSSTEKKANPLVGTVNTAGSFSNAIDRLQSKASRAYLTLRQNFNFHNGTSVKVMVKRFDSMVQPILLYDSELWAVFGWRKNDLDCIIKYVMSKKHTSEHLDRKFCKQTLGIDRFTPDLIAKAELGRFPLMGAMIKQTYSLWQDLLSLNDTSLSYKALQININGDRRGQDTYYVSWNMPFGGFG